jgi:hypothetical protein
MEEKQCIDRQRNAAISMRIGGGDGSTVKEVLSTGANLYVITETAVLRMQTADEIDPDRTNAGIPNLTQQVLAAGYNDEIVARILLTAAQLFDERNAKVEKFATDILETSMVLTKQLLELNTVSREFASEIREKEVAFAAAHTDPNAFALPSVQGLEMKVHNVLSSADKAKDSILALCRLQFLPDASTKPNLTALNKAIEDFMPRELDRLDAWKQMANYFTLIRNLRNASEHPKEGQGIDLSDFRMWPDGRVYPPLVEVRHPETPIGKLPVVELLEFIRSTIIDHAEVVLAFIKSANLLRNNPFKETVAEFSIDHRRHKFVRFYRAVNMNGTWCILG